jgi:hypothetical protein
MHARILSGGLAALLTLPGLGQAGSLFGLDSGAKPGPSAALPIDPTSAPSTSRKLDLAVGATAGFTIQEPTMGTTIGAAVCLMFFTASGEWATYLVTPAGGQQFPDPEHLPRLARGQLRHVGGQLSLQAGGEVAVYDGPSTRTLSPAATFEGVFHTVEVSAGAADAGLYHGEPDADGGRWYGGTLVASLGPPGAGYVGWQYTRIDVTGELRGLSREAVERATEAARSAMDTASLVGDVARASSTAYDVARDLRDRLATQGVLQSALQTAWAATPRAVSALGGGSSKRDDDGGSWRDWVPDFSNRGGDGWLPVPGEGWGAALGLKLGERLLPW